MRSLVFVLLAALSLIMLSGVESKRYFPNTEVWFTDVSGLTPDPNSNAIVNWVNSNGAFGGSGTGGKMKVDFSFYILKANASTPKVPLQKSAGYYTPDCDNLPGGFPLPPGGRIEGQTGYTCADEDCHLLVVHETEKLIYESYISNVNAGKLQSTCALTWDMCTSYPTTLRGDQCTSTDAAGFPITQLLFTAEELLNGTIDHAIRFILPNNEMRSKRYVRPATHAGGPSSTNTNSAVYGTRWRLKSTFNVNALKPAARVVARALQKYGMLLSDGGRIALTAASDGLSSVKYASLPGGGFSSNDLNLITPLDFEVMPLGSLVTLTYDCVRNTITRPPGPCAV